MANDFKVKYATNVLSTGTGSILYDAPISPLTGSGAILSSILLEVDIANTTSSDITVDCKLNKNSGGTGGTDDIFIIKGAPLPAGGALKVVSGQKIVMMSTSTGADTVTVAASVANSADCIVSLLEGV